MLVSEDIGKLFFVLLTGKKSSRDWTNHRFASFITFYKMSKLFWKWGCSSCEWNANLHL